MRHTNAITAAISVFSTIPVATAGAQTVMVPLSRSSLVEVDYNLEERRTELASISISVEDPYCLASLVSSLGPAGISTTCAGSILGTDLCPSGRPLRSRVQDLVRFSIDRPSVYTLAANGAFAAAPQYEVPAMRVSLKRGSMFVNQFSADPAIGVCLGTGSGILQPHSYEYSSSFLISVSGGCTTVGEGDAYLSGSLTLTPCVSFIEQPQDAAACSEDGRAFTFRAVLSSPALANTSGPNRVAWMFKRIYQGAEWQPVQTTNCVSLLDLTLEELSHIPVGGEGGPPSPCPSGVDILLFQAEGATSIGDEHQLTVTDLLFSGTQFRCVVFNDCDPQGNYQISEPATARLIRCGCSADYNHDDDIGTDGDIEEFFRCLAGSCCRLCTPDFNGDGDIGTDADIESFFRVLSGGPC
jgi:hypothetical protein